MKAVIYTRYFSDSQREESIEGQIRECTAFAEKNGITVPRRLDISSTRNNTFRLIQLLHLSFLPPLRNMPMVQQ